jgi:glucosamine--fructose-6-phosphate aminotransferase (isomerizing)
MAGSGGCAVEATVPQGSAFEREAAEIPALLAKQTEQIGAWLAPLVTQLAQRDPALFATIARGSSENAAAFARYAVSLQLGLPSAPLPPSVASVYGQTLRMERALVLAISQSGASPDLALAARAARAGGALCLGLLNEPGSALGQQLDIEIPMGAGPEHAVAASKTFVLSVTAASHLIAAWRRDEALRAALAALPETLMRCGAEDWTAAVRALAGRAQVFVIGRGPALPIAQELALKLEEVSGLHAQAHSAAELLHGPISIASDATPAIVFAGDRSSHDSLLEAAARLRAAGAPVVMLGSHATGDAIQVPAAGHKLLQALVALYAAYPFLARLARERGRDPDRPPHLEKATRTR